MVAKNIESRIALMSSVLALPVELSQGCHYTAEREDEVPEDKLSSQQASSKSLLCTLLQTSLSLFLPLLMFKQ